MSSANERITVAHRFIGVMVADFLRWVNINISKGSYFFGNSSLTRVNEPVQKGMHFTDYGEPVRFSRVNTMYQIFLICLLSIVGCQTPQPVSEEGFTSLFDGQSLKGWILLNPKGSGYAVTNLVETSSTNAVIYCAKGGGGNLMSSIWNCDFTEGDARQWRFRRGGVGNAIDITDSNEIPVGIP